MVSLQLRVRTVERGGMGRGVKGVYDMARSLVLLIEPLMAQCSVHCHLPAIAICAEPETDMGSSPCRQFGVVRMAHR